MIPLALHTVEEFQQARSSYERILVFKFSNRCPISHYAEVEARAFLNNLSDFPAYTVDVIGDRPLSKWIESELGVRHESPQVLLIQGNQVIWHESHGEISRDELSRQLQPFCKDLH